MTSEHPSDQMDKPETSETPQISPQGPTETEIVSSNHSPAPASTSVPNLSSAKDRDGSVISGMTDVGSLDCPVVPPPPVADSEVVSSNSSENLGDVPKQVILEETAPDAPTNSPTSTQPTEDQTATPEPPEKRKESVSSQNEASQKDRESVRSVSPPPSNTETDGDDNVTTIDEYIQSPEIQSAIVERSPGGRYIRFNEKLGSGASKDVFRAYDTQEGIEVAWNVVNLSGVPKTERNRIVNEVRLLERLHHQNIISFHGSWVNRERQEVNFVTEILSSGTLKSFINKVQVIRWKIAKRWAIQILKGLEYLHLQDPPVIHRDLKCDNIFINGTSGDLRIGDLGLSTVSQNGRVLSVLGTPEFMAPDMYDDTSYDERVDVYAFGMCLLEIFTQEIPYSECTNPAQIYKKVSAGEYPEVLSRLQSKHARAFVKLCLGYKDEKGEYIRPKVTELLKHPFLEKRPTDEEEVVVDQPLIKRTIPESTSEVTQKGTPQPRRKVPSKEPPAPPPVQASTTRQQSHGNSATPRASRKQAPVSKASDIQDDDDGDRFEEMQQSEINMRKVTVLMGRDQELEEDEAVASADQEDAQSEPSNPTVTPDESELETKTAVSEAKTSPPSLPATEEKPLDQSPEENEKPAPQYLVAAAVIEHENPNARPYADDVLKLVVTLPVDGQTQNVQFDFHLVKDDPVQVAKEMVQELRIPPRAVLEISETISGLARKARMRQDKYGDRKQTPAFQQQGMPPNQQVQMQHQGYDQPQYHPQHQGGQQVHQLQGQQQIPTQGVMQSGASQQDFQQFMQGRQPPMNQGQPQMMHQGNMEVQQRTEPPFQQQHAGHVVQQQMQHPGYNNAMAPAVPPRQPQEQLPPQQQQQQQMQFHQQGMQQSMPLHRPQDPLPHYQQVAPPVPDQSQHQQQGVPQEQSAYPQNPAATQVQPPATHAQSGMNAKPAHSAGAQDPLRQHLLAQQSSQQGLGPNSMPMMQQQSHAHVPSVMPTTVQDPQGSQEAQAHAAGIQPSQGSHNPPLRATVPPSTPSAAATLPPPVPAPNPPLPAQAPQNVARNAQPFETTAPSTKGSQRSDSLGTISSTGLEDDSDEDVNEELQKLDAEFHKSMERAKRVFDTRLDNLQRSQVEKEAQHKKTLEKHEKERIEFEKRLAQEAEKKKQRIAQLQKDWDERRNNVRKHKNGMQHSAPEFGHDSSGAQSSGSTATDHKRTASQASSTFSISPSISAHKQSQDTTGGDGPSDKA